MTTLFDALFTTGLTERQRAAIALFGEVRDALLARRAARSAYARAALVEGASHEQATAVRGADAALADALERLEVLL